MAGEKDSNPSDVVFGRDDDVLDSAAVVNCVPSATTVATLNSGFENVANTLVGIPLTDDREKSYESLVTEL